MGYCFRLTIAFCVLGTRDSVDVSFFTIATLRWLWNIAAWLFISFLGESMGAYLSLILKLHDQLECGFGEHGFL